MTQINSFDNETDSKNINTFPDEWKSVGFHQLEDK